MGNGLGSTSPTNLAPAESANVPSGVGPQKQEILEECVTATGYVRNYTQWLLNHVEEVFAPPTALRRSYGPEVEEASVRFCQNSNAWKTDEEDSPEASVLL